MKTTNTASRIYSDEVPQSLLNDARAIREDIARHDRARKAICDAIARTVAQSITQSQLLEVEAAQIVLDRAKGEYAAALSSVTTRALSEMGKI